MPESNSLNQSHEIVIVGGGRCRDIAHAVVSRSFRRECTDEATCEDLPQDGLGKRRASITLSLARDSHSHLQLE